MRLVPTSVLTHFKCYINSVSSNFNLCVFKLYFLSSSKEENIFSELGITHLVSQSQSQGADDSRLKEDTEDDEDPDQTRTNSIEIETAPNTLKSTEAKETVRTETKDDGEKMQAVKGSPIVNVTERPATLPPATAAAASSSSHDIVRVMTIEAEGSLNAERDLEIVTDNIGDSLADGGGTETTEKSELRPTTERSLTNAVASQVSRPNSAPYLNLNFARPPLMTNAKSFLLITSHIISYLPVTATAIGTRATSAIGERTPARMPSKVEAYDEVSIMLDDNVTLDSAFTDNEGASRPVSQETTIKNQSQSRVQRHDDPSDVKSVRSSNSEITLIRGNDDSSFSEAVTSALNSTNEGPNYSQNRRSMTSSSLSDMAAPPLKSIGKKQSQRSNFVETIIMYPVNTADKSTSTSDLVMTDEIEFGPRSSLVSDLSRGSTDEFGDKSADAGRLEGIIVRAAAEGSANSAIPVLVVRMFMSVLKELEILRGHAATVELELNKCEDLSRSLLLLANTREKDNQASVPKSFEEFLK